MEALQSVLSHVQASMDPLGLVVSTQTRSTSFCDICQCHEAVENCATLSCQHSFCKICLSTYLTSRITSGQIHAIPCPFIDEKSVQCTRVLGEDEIARLVSASALAQYHRYMFASDPTQRECSKCHKFIKQSSKSSESSESSETSELICECGHSFCFTHGDAHIGVDCKTYETSYQLQRDNSYVRKLSKPCPTCGAAIHKFTGCNHMKCSACQTNFCWLCVQVIENDTIPQHFKVGSCKQFEDAKQEEEDGDPYRCPQWLMTNPCAIFLTYLVSAAIGLVSGIVAIIGTILVLPAALCSSAWRPDLVIRKIWDGAFFGCIVILCLIFWPCFCALLCHMMCQEQEAENNRDMKEIVVI